MKTNCSLKATWFLTCVLAVVSLSAPALAVTCFAKSNGVASGACDSWANACTVNHALSANATCTEVLVKAGTYGPVTLKNNVKVFGGFAGTEVSPSQSAPEH